MIKVDVKNAMHAGRIIKRAEGINNRDVNKLIIDRRFWLRGGIDGSQLLTKQSNDGIGACCLGFLCLQRGMNVIQIYGTSTPAWTRQNRSGIDIQDLPKSMSSFAIRQKNGFMDSDLTNALVCANDTVIGDEIDLLVSKVLHKPVPKKLSTETQRERLITSLFKTASIEVEFVN